MSEINQTVTQSAIKDARYSFGAKWNKSVQAGAVRDFRKLIAHAAHVKVLSETEYQEFMSKLEDIRAEVSEILAQSQDTDEGDSEAEVDSDADTSESDVEASDDSDVNVPCPAYNPDSSVVQGASV